jgi:hypothetical protein
MNSFSILREEHSVKPFFEGVSLRSNFMSLEDNFDEYSNSLGIVEDFIIMNGLFFLRREIISEDSPMVAEAFEPLYRLVQPN